MSNAYVSADPVSLGDNPVGEYTVESGLQHAPENVVSGQADVPASGSSKVSELCKASASGRIGILIVMTAIGLLACASIQSATPGLNAFHSVLWVIAIAGCSLSGLVSMRTLRGISTIESLLSARGCAGQSIDSLKPVIGDDDLVDGWNDLLLKAQSADMPSDQLRGTATLDREAITMARAMRGLPIAWVVTDTIGQIQFLSPAASGLLGLDDDAAENAVGRDLLGLLGFRTSRHDVSDPQVKQLTSPLRMVQVKRKVDFGGQEVQLRIVRSRLPGREGDSEGLAWALTDITQQQLATDARDQFLMTATHELRTPLNNLHAYAEALQDSDDDKDRQSEFCNIMISESKRLGRLVDHLLTVGQLEAGSMVVHRHELDLLPIVQQCESQVVSQAAAKGITMKMELAAKMPTVVGDRDKLSAAIVNIVGNAVKYTPSGGEVTIRSCVEGQTIKIEIADTGQGIPEDELTKVFDKFYRCSNASETDERGNGLGLAFSLEIAKLHGGTIDVRSVVDVGTTFTLNLPAAGHSRSGV